MSWQDYIDKQLLASRCVTKAAIAGHDGNLWAKSEGFEVSNVPRTKEIVALSQVSILGFTFLLRNSHLNEIQQDTKEKSAPLHLTTH